MVNCVIEFSSGRTNVVVNGADVLLNRDGTTEGTEFIMSVAVGIGCVLLIYRSLPVP